MFIVMYQIGSFGAREERRFNELEDARAFRDLLIKSNADESYTYFIVQVVN